MRPDTRNPSARTPRSAFTLVELLIVCAVIALLLIVVLPPLVGTMAAARLTAAGDQVQALLSQAQQIASSEGRPVEVRFYRHVQPDAPGSTSSYRTILLLRHYNAGEPSPVPDENGAVLDAAITLHQGDSVRLPDGVVISSSATSSTLLTLPAPSSQAQSATWLLSGGGKTPYTFPVADSEYRSFIFRPTSTSLPAAGSDRWFITLISDVEESAGVSIDNIPNYYCLQIDPVNGRITTYRP